MRWFGNAVAAGVGKGTVKSESDRSSRKASDAKRRFDYAKRALELNPKSARANHWFAVLIGKIGIIEGTEQKIINSYFLNIFLKKRKKAQKKVIILN